MKKICVLGAGISGLSFAKIAGDSFDVELLERAGTWGGIARTRSVDGATYHPVGGHCFNSKYNDVLSFVFEKVLSKDQWHLVQRDAVIKFRGREIGYPIEYHVKDLFNLDNDLALNVTRDFLSAYDDGKYLNLEQWFIKKFGNTLAEVYFVPYNKKIWNNNPVNMSPAWVEGKLPIPDKKSFLKSLIGDEQDKMPHASFYYPNSNDQNTFIDALAKDLTITCNYEVSKLEYDEKKEKWIINGEKEADYIVNTIPLNCICNLLTNVPAEILNWASKLKYNSVTTMLWETEDTNRTWTYIPESENFFHRYIHIGNFFQPKKNITITEVVGRRTEEEMIENGKKDPFLLKPLAYNVSDHAYVVFDQNYTEAVTAIRQYLDKTGINTLGRFGEWEYYNMDICIKKAMELFKNLKVS